MKKSYQISWSSLLLLLIYTLSNVVALWFHHHDSGIRNYQQANPCEKAIHFLSKTDNCLHKAHLTKATEKCNICDQQCASPHLLSQRISSIYPNTFVGYNATVGGNYTPIRLTNLANKGPPSAQILV